ncbi:hypothetical protein Mgra_00008532 [Meloidogyne graminicola]|uniref:Uncharacterized protein n=1 Tax=Meloidogyne graminicola TaxID=189291 RepID=A0A8S9ZFN4_9BILA|nr:hypothetical protein Mgra_00008532 [Meloidogyne graminicola]
MENFTESNSEVVKQTFSTKERATNSNDNNRTKRNIIYQEDTLSNSFIIFEKWHEFSEIWENFNTFSHLINLHCIL